MLEDNAKKIMQKIRPQDKVLDVGGWARPFNRANVVIDIYPYETRGFFGSQGGSKEYFTKKTWIIHDISSKKRLPFKNKSFDFVICSQTLEDIRDPLFLCSELQRVAKRGYIEFPSEKAELTLGISNNRYCGYYHHRWLIHIEKEKLLFRFKPHFIHTHWKFHFPKRYLSNLPENKRAAYLFWENSFKFGEVIQISRDKVQDYIFNIIKKEKVYPSFYYLFDNLILNYLFLLSTLKKFFNPKGYFHRFMDTREYLSQ